MFLFVVVSGCGIVFEIVSVLSAVSGVAEFEDGVEHRTNTISPKAATTIAPQKPGIKFWIFELIFTIRNQKQTLSHQRISNYPMRTDADEQTVDLVARVDLLHTGLGACRRP